MAQLTDEERERIQQEMAEGAQQQEGPQMFETSDLAEIHRVIGVVSGKGGVGKSMVSGMLAVELARAGHSVGILDADVTGPSIPKMFGLSNTLLSALDDNIVPATTAGGIKVVSTNLMLRHEDDPVVWRGPVIAGAIQQFWGQTAWGNLDYLICDMPPGTSDVALTIFQSVPVEGLVVVTSPQDLVQVVVGKALNMAAMMEVPVLGLVENMSYATCPDCGRRIEVFGPSHIEETAAHFHLPVLGRLPIDPALAAAADSGRIEQDLPQGMLPDAVSLAESLPDMLAERMRGAVEGEG